MNGWRSKQRPHESHSLLRFCTGFPAPALRITPARMPEFFRPPSARVSFVLSHRRWNRRMRTLEIRSISNYNEWDFRVPDEARLNSTRHARHLLKPVTNSGAILIRREK